MGGVGQRNVLVEGVSGTGKSSVLRELRRRGYQAVDGDNELAYQGDPLTGEPTDTTAHENHVWDVARVRSLVDDRSVPVTFFCGGSRNHAQFLHLFDVVVVLCVDRATLERRLGQRRDEFGATSAERALVLRLHATHEDVPAGTAVDATAPLEQVVDEVVSLAGRGEPQP